MLKTDFESKLYAFRNETDHALKSHFLDVESAVERAVKANTQPPDLSALVGTVDFAALENRVRELKLRVDSQLDSIFVG